MNNTLDKVAIARRKMFGNKADEKASGLTAVLVALIGGLIPLILPAAFVFGVLDCCAETPRQKLNGRNMLIGCVFGFYLSIGVWGLVLANNRAADRELEQARLEYRKYR